MASARTSGTTGEGTTQAGGGLFAILIYFALLLLLLLVFCVVGFVACSAPVPTRVGFFPPL
jgi:hypothetical protein